MNFKRFLSTVLCIIICLCIGTNVFAIGEQNTIVKVSSVTAMPGESVVIDISISNNPGIMAMAFCIVYDSEALVFDEDDTNSFKRGYITNHTIKDHADKGHISFVNVENKDINTSGTIMSITFTVNKDAKPGKHPIFIANSNREKYGTKLDNIFSNSQQKFIVPASISGGVTVMETCENSGHKYSGWNIISQNTCTTDGLKNRTCLRCQINEESVIPAACDFETEWTIDKIATPEEDGIMSRHCKNCDNVTDKIIFSYEEIGGGDDDNTSSDTDSSEDTSSGDTSGDNTSSNDTSSDNTSSENNSSGNNTSDNNSSNTSSGNSIGNGSSNKNDLHQNNSSNKKPNSSSSKNNTTSDTSNKKPVINNVVGEKVTLEEVEKLADYQQNIKPNLKQEETSSIEDVSSTVSTSETDSKPSTSSKPKNDTSGSSTDTTPDHPGTIAQTDEPSFFATPSGIVMIIVCSLLSIGIIALGVILILRNKKSEEQ